MYRPLLDSVWETTNFLNGKVPFKGVVPMYEWTVPYVMKGWNNILYHLASKWRELYNNAPRGLYKGLQNNWCFMVDKRFSAMYMYFL